MKGAGHASIALLLALVLTAPSIQAQLRQALVWSLNQPGVEVGQAWLMRHGEDCLAVLPAHVAQEAVHVALLGEGGELRGQLESVTVLEGDLAFGPVTGGLSAACGSPLGTYSRSVSGLLAAGGEGTLRLVNGDGSLGRAAVAVVDDDGRSLLRIQPSHEASRLRKGQSGALLVVRDRPVGMLLSVSSRNGSGAVLRVSTLLSALERARSEQARRERSRRAEQSSGARTSGWVVSYWSEDPIDADSRASNVLELEPGRDWKVRPVNWPVVVELTSIEGLGVVSEIEIRAPLTRPSEEWASSVRMTSTLEDSGRTWRNSRTIQLDFDDQGAFSVSFAPLRARRLRMEFFNDSLAGQFSLAAICIGPCSHLEPSAGEPPPD